MALFSKIAISLSGGGFRAAAFHLGTLSYLDSLKINEESLLEKVQVLSTNSGGTITGLLFALHAYSGKSFLDFYQKTYRLLKEDRLFDNAFSNIQTSANWSSQTRSRNLINAFAEYYHREVFDEATFNIFQKPGVPLHTVIFNATEFNYGLPFRFQNKGLFGNRYYRIPDYLKSDIRLGDILAASTCFPGGFEPLKWPDDFCTTSQDELFRFWQESHRDPIAIMDGGIVDNQGINSILLEAERSDTPITTLIVSDVQRWSGPFNFPEFSDNSWLKKWSINRIFKTIRWGFFLFTALVIGSATFYLFSYNILLKSISLILVILSSMGLVLSIGAVALKRLAVSKVTKILTGMFGKKETSFWDQMNFILDLPLSQLNNLLQQRQQSFLKIVSDIFMNRISSLQIQEVLYDEAWRGRAVHLNIGKLIDLNTKDNPVGMSSDLREIIETACKMDTTLWFSDKNADALMLDKLIIAAQATLCFTLSEYIDAYRTNRKSQMTSEEDSLLRNMYLKLHEDWEHFNNNPFWMLKRV